MGKYKNLSPKEKREYWKKHIDAWQHSGQSQTKYCHSQKIKKSTFGYWRTRLSREEIFVKVPIELESHSALEIIIKDSIKVQIRKDFDPELLLETVKTLEQLS